MTDSARLPALRPMVVDGEVLAIDGVTQDDIRRAEVGRRMKPDYPGAVTDPAKVAELRRDMERHRPLDRTERVLVAAAVSTGLLLALIVVLVAYLSVGMLS